MGSIPSSGINKYVHPLADVAQLVEPLLPKQEVASSSPVIRFHTDFIWAGSSVGRAADS
jgi:hypothetical protein